MNFVKLSLAIFLCFSLPLLSQTFSIGAGSGLNFMLGNNYYTDELGRIGRYENINGTNTNLTGMGLSNEWQFQIMGKYLFINSPFSLTAGFIYMPMRGNEQLPIYDFILNQEIQKDVTTKMDIWAFQLGTNYSFDMHTIKPFITVSLSANYFGDVWIEFSETDYISEFRSYQNGMRYGYCVGIGLDYCIYSNLELEVSSNYNSLNLLGRREEEELLNSINILFNIYYRIN